MDGAERFIIPRYRYHDGLITPDDKAFMSKALRVGLYTVKGNNLSCQDTFVLDEKMMMATPRSRDRVVSILMKLATGFTHYTEETTTMAMNLNEPTITLHEDTFKKAAETAGLNPSMALRVFATAYLSELVKVSQTMPNEKKLGHYMSHSAFLSGPAIMIRCEKD